MSNLSLIGIISLFLLVGCSRAENPSHVKILYVQQPTEPISLDPALAEDGPSLRVLSNVMEGLLGYDGTGKLQNFLAETVRVLPDGKTYEFTLRKNARWSDGEAVTPEHFIVGIRRALSPDTGAKMAGMLFPIRGAKDFHSRKAGPEALGVRVQGQKLIIELEKPHPYFMQAFSLFSMVPERQDVLDSHGGRWPEDAPSTGPYRIVKRILDRKIILEKNVYYWGAPPRIPRVELLIVADDSTGSNLFEQGALDILTRVGSVEFKRFQKKGVLHVDPFLATAFVAFNPRKPPFNNRQWRRAIAASIRKKELVSALDTGEAPACGLIPVGLEGYLPFESCGWNFDDSVEWAKKNGPYIGTAQGGFDGGSRSSMIMEKIQSDLLKTLGMTLSLSSMDWKSYVRNLSTDAPGIYRFAWMTPFLDPVVFMSIYRGQDNPNNYAGWVSHEYDALLSEIETLPPGPKRQFAMKKAQRIIIEKEALIIPLYHYTQANAVSPRVEGFRASPFGIIRFNELDLKEHSH